MANKKYNSVEVNTLDNYAKACKVIEDALPQLDAYWQNRVKIILNNTLDTIAIIERMYTNDRNVFWEKISLLDMWLSRAFIEFTKGLENSANE